METVETEISYRESSEKHPLGGLRVLGAALMLVSLTGAASAGTSALAGVAAEDSSSADRGGVIYAMTNASGGNEILAFARSSAGRLSPVPGATVSTGGLGGSVTAAVDPLGSQNSLIYDADTKTLFAVNAGDDTVASLDARRGLQLRLEAVVPSGGFIPVSLAVSEDRLYVLNAGGTGSVATFAIEPGGNLRQVGSLDLGLTPTATTPPFDRVAAPGQVGVDALARHLIVTHAGGQELLVAELDDDGVPVGPLVATVTPGAGTFAFDVTRYGTIVVAEAASASVSAFDPPSGTEPLTVTASAIGTGQAATCWLVVHGRGFAYVSNTASNTLSLYRYSRTGDLELVSAVAATAGQAPTDLTLAGRGRYLYSLDSASGEISGFAIDSETGALTAVETQGDLPASAGIQGIAALDF